jgi:hypothetical protein
LQDNTWGKTTKERLKERQLHRIEIFKVFTAVTIKKVVFWDIKSCSYLTGDTTSPLQSLAGECYVRFEVFMAVTTKNAVFLEIVPTSQEPHYIPATEPRRLMLCKI